jgi:acetoin utilization protein AcuB
MHVKDWMTRDPVTVTEATPLAEAYRIFHEYEIRHLPVVRGGRLVGIISNRDISRVLLQRLGEGSVDELGTVGDAMITKVLTASPDEDVATAALRMHDAKIGALPVIDEQRNVVGILTTQDLLEILVAELKKRRPIGADG